MRFGYFYFVYQQLVKSIEFIFNGNRFQNALFIALFKRKIISRGVYESVGVGQRQNSVESIFCAAKILRRDKIAHLVFNESEIRFGFVFVAVVGFDFFNPDRKIFFGRINLAKAGGVQRFYAYAQVIRGHTRTMFDATNRTYRKNVGKFRIFYVGVYLRRDEQERVALVCKRAVYRAERFFPPGVERSGHVG